MKKNNWVKITALASFVFLQTIYAVPAWADPVKDGYEVTDTDTAVGKNADADVSHNWLGCPKEDSTNNTAIGSNAKATAGNSTAIGAGAQANKKGSVALGEGSIADRENTVSVGKVGKERQITNVAAGTQGTDAVNFGQLDKKADKSYVDGKDAALDNKKADKSYVDEQDAALDKKKADKSYVDEQDTALDKKKADKSYVEEKDTALDNRITSETQRLDSRIDNLSSRVDKVGALAAAFSALAPMPYDPAGPTQISMGVGTYSGQQAMAIGVYHYVKNDVLLNAGFAISGSEKMGRAGVTWKIGGPKTKKVASTNDKSIVASANSNLSLGNEQNISGTNIGVSSTEKDAS